LERVRREAEVESLACEVGFHLQNGCIPSPPPPRYNVAVSNVKKVMVMPRVFTNIVPGEGDGFLEDILEIVQHSLYLMSMIIVQSTYTAKNDQVVAILTKTGLNRVLLPTSFTVVNNIEQYSILLHPIQAQKYIVQYC
jgi:hypothetical protein